MTTSAVLASTTPTLPVSLGVVCFQPTIESIRKFAYAAEDESGWLVGDPEEGRVHPAFLATLLWWPSGFYVREEGAVGHFSLFRKHFPELIGPQYIHAKTAARFFSTFRVGERLSADTVLIDRYVKKARDFIVLKVSFCDEGGGRVAEYEHTIAIRSVEPSSGGSSAKQAQTGRDDSGRQVVSEREVSLTLEKSRLFSLPDESYHTRDDLAQERGLRVAVPAATMSWAYLSKMGTDHFGDKWLTGGTLNATFVRMLYRDDILNIRGYEASDSASDTGPWSRLGLEITNNRDEVVAVGMAAAPAVNSAEGLKIR